MARVANLYFQDLFQSSSPQNEAIERILEVTPVCISEDQNHMLTTTFTREEIFGVIRSMHPTRAPGPDGIQAIFYRKYWDIVGKDLSEFCLQFLNGEKNLDQINNTYCTDPRG